MKNARIRRITEIAAVIIVIILAVTGVLPMSSDTGSGETNIVAESTETDVREETAEDIVVEKSEPDVEMTAEPEAEQNDATESETEQSDAADAEIERNDVTESEAEQNDKAEQEEEEIEPADVYFRNESLLQQHYEKHGIEMGFASAEEYERAAAKVVANPNALHKLEAEDGDDVYYLEETNEFVVVSTQGYIRTYFNPSAGISYYNRQ